MSTKTGSSQKYSQGSDHKSQCENKKEESIKNSASFQPLVASQLCFIVALRHVQLPCLICICVGFPCGCVRNLLTDRSSVYETYEFPIGSTQGSDHVLHVGLAERFVATPVDLNIGATEHKLGQNTQNNFPDEIWHSSCASVVQIQNKGGHDQGTRSNEDDDEVVLS